LRTVSQTASTLKELLEKLNDSQREAVLYNDGPSLIIAGAGSGKTRVLTYKIAALLKSGLPPWTIMALTFTNKAAREMKDRIASLVDPAAASRLWMGTFHSIFLRMLRSEAALLGYPANFTIYDTADSKNLLKSIIKDMNLDDKVYKVGTVQARISAAKNDLVSPEAYAANPQRQLEDIQARRPLLKEVYQRYTERCRLASAMDFDDILLMTNILFRDHPEVLAAYQDRFRFILVDEYQDTNFSQYLIVKKLSEKHHRVCVVGDDSQSIYSFRGANIDNILKFKENYPESRLFKLEQNYRSTQTIVNAANSLIAKNKGQIHKTVYSKNDVGQRIKVLSAYSDIEEGFIIANRIQEMHLSSYDPLNDFVILYRTNAQSRIFEESLRKRNLPYRVYGGLSFYQRKEIKDVIAYLRLVLNADDEEAFKRVVNYPARGIGDTTQQKLVSAASAHQVGMGVLLSNLAEYQVPVNAGTSRKLEAFATLMNELRALVSHRNVYELTNDLLAKTGLLNDLNLDTSMEAISRKENIQELLAGMNDFVTTKLEEGNKAVYLSDYLAEVSLLTDQDEEKSAEGDRVTMMTIHAAKGLEFRYVFVVGLEEDMFPSTFSQDSERALEEERRLLYVALTRAEKACVFSYAKSRFRNGTMNFTRPSRFLSDLDPAFLDVSGAATGSVLPSKQPLASSGYRGQSTHQDRSTFQRERPAVQPERSFPQREASRKLTRLTTHSQEPAATSATPEQTPAAQAQGDLAIGKALVHERFGRGVIEKIEGSGPDRTITVQFENTGQRKLLLKFAKFTLES
jgi:DNA helicase-2/ATP-dependent DNA helicase PcrA